jgi:putative ABC transport system permease protein
LIVSELTLALMLLIGASLLVKSFWKLMDVNPGFDPTHMQTFRLRLPDWKYDNPEMAIRAVKELRRRIGELPGVIRVGITSGIPLGRSDEESYWLEGQPEPANELQWPAALSFFVDENLCRTLGIPLLAGRMLSERDTDDTPPVVLVDDEFVRENFGGDVHAALGRRLRFKGNNEPWRRSSASCTRRALWVGGTRSRRSLPAVAASEVDDGQSRFSLPASNGFRGENRRRTELVSACDQNRAAQDRQRSSAWKRANA